MSDLIKERRELFLERLISESIANVIIEQEMQNQQVSSVPPAAPGPAPETNSIDPDSSSNTTQTQDKEVFDVDSMVDKLNVLRGSRSFTDPEVYGRLTTFFKQLTDEQKTSLDWLLTELGKVVIDATEQEVGAQAQHTGPTTQQMQAPQQKTPVASAPTAPAAPVTPSNI